MQEDFLHYVWKMKLFDMSVPETTDGEPVLIFQVGEHNTNAGPDFLNAKIKIGDTTWAGNVEIHVRSSDWKLHNHQHDRSYDNVILHVVFEHDEDITTIPTLELKNKIREGLHNRYKFLMQTSAWIPCAKKIASVPDLTVRSCLSRMCASRLEAKSVKFLQRLMLNENNWEETCYQLIARTFGTPVNSDPFERVARSLPYKILRKHLNQQIQVEALLFGQAGFLEAHFRELYPNQLQAEYKFLRLKYNLEPIRSMEWKFLRMRPANFPTIRMSQFANLIASHDILFSEIIAADSVKSLQGLLKAEAGSYWHEHYHFQKPAHVKSVAVGKSMINLILINTIAPLLYLYGHQTDDDSFTTKSIELLESLPAEGNNVIKRWKQLGIIPNHAGESQALIELKDSWCRLKRCLECSIGYQVLKNDG